MRAAATRALLAIAAGIALNRTLHPPVFLVLFGFLSGIALLRLTRGFSLYFTLAASALLFARAREPLPPHPGTYRVSGFRAVLTEEPTNPARVVAQLLPPLYGRVLLTLRPPLPELHYGDQVMVRAKVRPCAFPRNPGLDDFNRTLYEQGFVGSALVRPGALQLLSRHHGNPLLDHLVMPARRYLHRTVEKLLGGAEASLLFGLLLGEKSRLGKNLRRVFSESGTMHLLAVSGLHMSTVIWALGLLLAVLRIRGWWRFGILTGFALFYLLLVGVRASALRAGFMAWATLFSIPLQRRPNPFSSLAAAGIVLLIIDPGALFSAGAQLSFAATLAILFALTRFAQPSISGVRAKLNRLPAVKNYLLLPGLTSLAATLGTAPLLLHHFFRFQALAFLTNLILVPLVTISLPLGILVALVNLILPPLAGIFAESLRLLLKLILIVAHSAGNLQCTVIEPGRLPWFWVFYIYGVLFLLTRIRQEVARLILYFMLGAATLGLTLRSLLLPPENRVTFLDPGRGDAILLEDRFGRRLLIDAGIDRTEVVKNYLLSRGIKRLDAVLVTHPDRDHYGGLLDLADNQRTGLLIVPTTEGDTLYEKLLLRLKRSGTEIICTGRGARISGFDCSIKLLWPDATTRWLYARRLSRTNPVSLVCLVEKSGYRMLFTGDCEFPEIALPATEARPINLLKSPHHGSKKGNPETLFRLLKPELVVVSGRYPTPAGLETLLPKYHTRYINTRRSGGITLKLPSNVHP